MVNKQHSTKCERRPSSSTKNQSPTSSSRFQNGAPAALSDSRHSLSFEYLEDVPVASEVPNVSSFLPRIDPLTFQGENFVVASRGSNRSGAENDSEESTKKSADFENCFAIMDDKGTEVSDLNLFLESLIVDFSMEKTRSPALHSEEEVHEDDDSGSSFGFGNDSIEYHRQRLMQQNTIGFHRGRQATEQA